VLEGFVADPGELGLGQELDLADTLSGCGAALTIHHPIGSGPSSLPCSA